MNKSTEVPPELEVVRVTPEMASVWLDNLNKGNRRLSRTVVNAYAVAMAQGQWKLTHQSIAFDEAGFLLDGQHRLAAVVEAGVPVDFTVQRGWHRDAFAVVDTGFKRTASHFIDSPHANNVAAAARIIAGVSGLAVPPSLYYKSNPQEILEVVADWPELIESVIPARRVYEETKISASVHIAVLAQATRSRYADVIEDWIGGLSTGTDLREKDPRRLLRSRWIRDMKYLNSSIGRVAAYTLLVKAWNGFATGTDVGQLRSTSYEGLPLVTGIKRGAK